jgi:hypothetical protein
MRTNTQAAEQDKDKADAKIAALQRLANQEGLSHASSDKSQAVFTLGVDELIEFEGRPLEIPALRIAPRATRNSRTQPCAKDT